MVIVWVNRVLRLIEGPLQILAPFIISAILFKDPSIHFIKYVLLIHRDEFPTQFLDCQPLISKILHLHWLNFVYFCKIKGMRGRLSGPYVSIFGNSC